MGKTSVILSPVKKAMLILWLRSVGCSSMHSSFHLESRYQLQKDKGKVEKLISDGRVHLKFMCRLYKAQIESGRYFLHDHPASAVSWRVTEVEKVAAV